MDQPDAIPEHRKGLSKSLAIAALTGATAVALTLPTIAHAQPSPTPPPPAPPSGNTFMQGPPPPGEPVPPAAPVAPGAPVPPPADPNAPPPPPLDPNAPPAPPADPNAPPAPSADPNAAPPPARRAGPRRQHRGRPELRRACGLAGVGFHSAVVRPGVVDEDRAGRRAATERHERSARTARPEAVRRRRDRQHEGRPAAGIGYG